MPVNDDDWHGEHCQVCGTEYADVYSLPDEVWALISPRRSPGGLLCPSCALERTATEVMRLRAALAARPQPDADDEHQDDEPATKGIEGNRPAPVWNGAVEILAVTKNVPAAHRFNAFALAVAAFIQTGGTAAVAGSATPTGDNDD